jgi:hypothetical protein
MTATDHTRNPPRSAQAQGPFIARIGNDTKQFLATSAPDRRGNAKFGKVSANRVDD